MTTETDPAEAAKIIMNGLRERGFNIVPVEPSIGVLMSMAIREDHAFGVPGYYDNLPPQFDVGEGTHADKLALAIARMRKVYEEAVGKGFYSEDKEAKYVELYEASI